MKRNWKEAYEKFAHFGRPEISTIDPTLFQDANALNVKWTPLREESTNFSTHTLTQTADGSLIYHSTNRYRFIGLGFFIVGLIMLLAYFFKSNLPLIMLGLGIAFVLAGGYVVVSGIKPNGFIRPQKIYSKGWRGQKSKELGGSNVSIPFQDIYAIQLLRKVGTVTTRAEYDTSNPYFEAYELNLVGKSGDRQYVMTYIELDQIYQDAKEISKMIKIPVWNAIDGYKI